MWCFLCIACQKKKTKRKEKKGVKLQALYFYSPDLTSLIKFKNLKLASLWNAKEHGRAFRKALSSSGDSSGEQTKMLNIRGYFKHIKWSITGQGGEGGRKRDFFLRLTLPSPTHHPPPPKIYSCIHAGVHMKFQILRKHITTGTKSADFERNDY